MLHRFQELEYCEFFAGLGRVFEEVKGGAYPATKIDIDYLKGMPHAGRTNPFDFMTPAGFGSFACNIVQLFAFMYLSPVPTLVQKIG